MREKEKRLFEIFLLANDSDCHFEHGWVQVEKSHQESGLTT
jgi:hypothetical protein